MDFIWTDLFIFAFKIFVCAIAFIMVIVVPTLMIKQTSSKEKGHTLNIKNLKDKHFKNVLKINSKLLDKKDFKNYLKSHKKTQKKEKYKEKTTNYVLAFKGDIMATAVESLREEITLLLQIAKPQDEVILLLESPGGSVAHYGLAASQLQRLRDNNLKLTVCVDRVAASGGYLMACVGHQILSAPFAYIGSIGVLFGIPNVHDFLKKHDIRYEEITAGKYKRTLTPLSKVTEEKRDRLKEQLQLIHEQFKNFVAQYRSSINLEEVATGEAWLGQQALKMNLVDKIQCSDDYIMEKIKSQNVYQISISFKKSLLDKLSHKVESGQVAVKNKLLQSWNDKFLPMFF